MLRSVRFRFGMFGLTICLAGGIILHFLHWTGSTSSGFAARATRLSSSAETQPDSPKISSAVDEPFPSPDASATDEELLALARKIVACSPERAIDWARSQNDSGLRGRLLSTVIRFWGENDPAGAVNWALVQDDDERRMDMAAALAGAVKQPQLALAIVRRLLVNDPSDGADCGPALVVALNNAGQFQTALDFVSDGPADSRTGWTTATFRRWGESRPQDAIQAQDAIADESLRGAAFQAIVDGWSIGNPSTLAAHALSMPQGENRDYALNRAMDNWSLQDPAGLAAWLNTLAPGAEADAGAALILAKADGANYNLEVALGWVEGISDPELRLKSLSRVLDQWAQANPTGLVECVKNAAWLNDQQRATLLGKMATGH